MRIAFVVDIVGGDTGGGIVSADRFIAALRQHHEVTVVATGEPAPGKVVLPAWHPPVHVAKAHHFAFALPAASVLENVIADSDIVHAHLPFLCGIQALRIAEELHKPSVAAFHVQPENILYNIGIHSPVAAHWLYRRWISLFYEHASAVVCPSAFALNRLREHGLTVPAHVISNGVAPVPRGRRQHHHDGPLVVLCVGRLAPEKRQDVVMDAVARSQHRDNIRLIIAGFGPQEEQLREHAKRLNLPVEMGYLSDTALHEAYASADVFVHASEIELEGMSVLEAMASGLPVLIADATESAASLVAPGPDFLFRAGDADDLAAKLDRVLSSPAMRADASHASLNYAAHHRLAASTLQLEQLYASLVRKARAASMPPRVPHFHGAA